MPIDVAFTGKGLDVNVVDASEFAYFNALMLEEENTDITSDGVDVTFSLEKFGGGDLTLLFSTGNYVFDCTPPATVLLNVGSDSVPVPNYVYIPIDTKVLTVSTSGWPTGIEYVSIAFCLCQSAASVQANGIYSNHVWIEHLSDNIGNGHAKHINYWIRQQNATWQSGISLTPTVGLDIFSVIVAAGTVLQLHTHNYPMFDTSSGSHFFVPNDSGAAFARYTDLRDLLTDSQGVSLEDLYFSLVFWGAVSEDAGNCQLFVNLPTAGYANENLAILDSEQRAVYSIPSTFKGTGFLIARLVLFYDSGTNTWSLSSQVDLRSISPSNAAGSSGGGGITSVEDDPSPKLGGDLSLNGYSIISTDTAGKIYRSNGSIWTASTAVFADTYAASSLLYSNGPDNVTGLATVNGGTLRTNATGVPSMVQLLDGQFLLGATSGSAAAGTITAGTAISVTPSANGITVTNTAPDQTVVLTSGTGISATGTYPNFTITNTDLGSSVTLSSAGGTETLVNDGVGPALATKGLTAGAGMSLSSDATSITITNTDLGSSVTLSSAGGVETLVNDGTGPTLAVKGLTASTGISLSGSATAITITNTSPGSAVTLSNAGTTSLVNDGVGPDLALKGLVAGTGMAAFGTSSTDVTINLASPVPIALGGTNSTSAIGATGTLAQSNGTSYTFTTATYPSTGGGAGTIMRSTGTNWSNSTATFADTYAVNTILYAASANAVSGLATANSAILRTTSTGALGWSATMTNGQLLIGSTGGTPTAAALTQGTGITITNSAGGITITNSDLGSSVTLSNAGTTSLVNDGVGPALALKGLVSGTGISFSTSATDVTITNSDPASGVTLTNVGGTETLVNDGAGPALGIKGLIAGTGMTLSSNSTSVTFTNNDPGSAVTLSSAGGTQTLVNDGVGPALATKGLSAGSGIALSSDSTSVTVAVSGGGLSLSEVTGTSQAMAVNTRYIANNAGLVTFTLPTTMAVGEVIEICNKGAGLFKLAQNASQSCRYKGFTSTTGTGGSLTAQNRDDDMRIVCLTANTLFLITGGIGFDVV